MKKIFMCLEMPENSQRRTSWKEAQISQFRNIIDCDLNDCFVMKGSINSFFCQAHHVESYYYISILPPRPSSLSLLCCTACISSRMSDETKVQ